MPAPQSLAELETLLQGTGETDYEQYVNTPQILSAQKALDAYVNDEEAMFQIVHQIVELSMKLIVVSMHQIIQRLAKHDTHAVLLLFNRVHQLQRHIIAQFELINNMSPMEYQEIRSVLGSGSVRESPTYRTMVRMHAPMWQAFQQQYLHNLSLQDIYKQGGQSLPAYMLAQAFMQYDEIFQLFRYAHIQLIHRTAGPGALSLKGHPVDKLNDGLKSKLWPELWNIRTELTEAWNKQQTEAV